MGARKFEVGQYVVAGKDMYDIKVGDVLKVTSYASPTGLGEWVMLDGRMNKSRDGSYLEEYFKPWQPKVGDRVRVKQHRNAFGTVINGISPGSEVTLTNVVADISNAEREGWVPFGTDTMYLVRSDDIEPLPVVAQPSLTITAGKFYRTRDGRKVGPMILCGNYWSAENASGTPGDFTADGTSAYCGILPRDENRRIHDIIAEWVDEPAVAPVAVANDNAASAAKPKFKVGDRVRILRIRDAFGRDLKNGLRHIGSIVTLEARDTSIENEGEPWEAWDVVGGSPWWVRSDDIELVTPVTTTPTAIVALIENGQPKPSAFPHVHATEAAAAKEASRLAAVHKGKQFGVYVLTKTVSEPAPTYKHEWQRLAAKGEKIAAIKELRGITGLDLRATKDAVEHWLAHDKPVSRIAA